MRKVKSSWNVGGGGGRQVQISFNLSFIAFFVHLDLCSYSISIDWWFAWPCCRGLWAMLKATRCPFMLSCACRLIFSSTHSQWTHTTSEDTHRTPSLFLPPTDAHTQVKRTQTNGDTHMRTHLMHSLLSLSRLPNGSRLGVTLHPCHPLHPISVSFTFYCSVLRMPVTAEYMKTIFCGRIYRCTSYSLCTFMTNL